MELQLKLISLRKQKGLTQLDLADKLNLSRQAISRWEVGAAVPSIDNLKALSELYGVSLNDLLNDGNDSCNAKNDDDDSCDVKNDEKDSCKREQLQVSKGQEDTARKTWFVALMCALVFLLAILILIMIFKPMNHSEKNDKYTPIEDMETIVEHIYPTGTFSIE